MDDKRVDVNIADDYQQTPLIQAIKSAYVNHQLALLLIQNIDKCKINLKATCQGKTVMDVAKDVIECYSWTEATMIPVIDALGKAMNKLKQNDKS